jgi:serine/threonine-protein kinase
MRSSKHVDERSDIWALGAIAFELLTGKVPFDAGSVLELCFKVWQEDPPQLRALRPEIPEELERAVMRCLARDPAARFANVGDLAAALEPFAPARDHGTARRALDVLSTSARSRATAVPEGADAGPGSGDVDVPISTGERGLSATMAVAPVAGTASAPAPLPSAAEVGSAAWGTTHSQALEKKPPVPRGAVAMVAAGVAMLGAVAVMLAHAGGRGPTTGSSSAPRPTVESAGASITVAATEATTAAAPATGVPPIDAPRSPPARASIESTAPAASAASPRPAASAARIVPARSVTTVSSPRPSAAPSDPGEFIKVRE